MQPPNSNRPLTAALAAPLLLALSIPSPAQPRYAYRDTPDGATEVIDLRHQDERPWLLRRIGSDLRMLRDELGRGFEIFRPARRSDPPAGQVRHRTRHPHPAPPTVTTRPSPPPRREATIRDTRRDDDFARTPSPRNPALEPTTTRPETGGASGPARPVEPPAPRIQAEPKPQPKPDPDPDDDRGRGGREFSEAEKRNFPLARKTDKPGFVRSPYPPHELLDVTGIEPGGLAREPEGNRIFRVPR